MNVEAPSKLEAIYQDFERRILEGVWALGNLLPTETELAAEVQCSRSTISKVIARLAHEGLVERRKRAGTRVICNVTSKAKAAVELDAVAFIYPCERHEGIWRAAKGFQDAAHDHKQSVAMLSTNMDYHRETEFMNRLVEFAVKGVVIYPHLTTPEAQGAFVKAVSASRFPIVLTALNPLGLNCPVVTMDGFHAGYAVTRHLIERGAKKIGYLSDRVASFSMRERYLGYRKALEEASLTSQTEWVCLNPSMNVDLKQPMREPEAMAAAYLDQAREIDAVVCSTDFLAVAVLQAARARGLSVPDELKVAGMDDYEFSAKPEIGLTTYRIPYQEIGQKAYEVLADMIAGRHAPSSEALLRGSLIVRSSS